MLQSAHVQQAPQGWRRHPSVVLGVILTAQLMVVLDATIVNVALPHIQRSLHFSSSSLSWVLNAYVLTFGGLLLLGARSGDLLGRRRTFMTGIALFSLSSLAGGFATSSAMLLAARALQGVGGALAAPAALALLMTTLPGGGGPGAGHRPVHDRLGGGRGHGPGGGRPAHRVGVLALGHVRQRPHRPHRAPRRRGRARRDRAPPWPFRPDRGDHVHRRGDGRRVRPGRGRKPRLGGACHPRLARSGPGLAGSLRPGREDRPRAHPSRCRSSPTGPAPRPTWPAVSATPGCTG